MIFLFTGSQGNTKAVIIWLTLTTSCVLLPLWIALGCGTLCPGLLWWQHLNSCALFLGSWLSCTVISPFIPVCYASLALSSPWCLSSCSHMTCHHLHHQSWSTSHFLSTFFAQDQISLHLESHHTFLVVHSKWCRCGHCCWFSRCPPSSSVSPASFLPLLPIFYPFSPQSCCCTRLLAQASTSPHSLRLWG